MHEFPGTSPEHAPSAVPEGMDLPPKPEHPEWLRTLLGWIGMGFRDESDYFARALQIMGLMSAMHTEQKNRTIAQLRLDLEAAQQTPPQPVVLGVPGPSEEAKALAAHPGVLAWTSCAWAARHGHGGSMVQRLGIDPALLGAGGVGWRCMSYPQLLPLRRTLRLNSLSLLLELDHPEVWGATLDSGYGQLKPPTTPVEIPRTLVLGISTAQQTVMVCSLGGLPWTQVGSGWAVRLDATEALRALSSMQLTPGHALLLQGTVSAPGALRVTLFGERAARSKK